ncbi:MAG: fibronectin type III domain-containing protein [Aquimonas sp.]|nr:fibronectin type III domain-containing protein [Aquimonas sp.]
MIRATILLSALILMVPGGAWAFSYVMLSDEALLQQSEGVARMRVLEAVPAADGDRETVYRLQRIEQFKGAALEAHVALALPGTHDAPSLNFVVAGVPRLVPGGEVLLFFSRRPDGTLQAQQLSLGVFGRIRADNGAEYYVRDLEGSAEYPGRGFTLQYHAPRAPAAFEDWIRRRVAGHKADADYLRTAVRSNQLAKYTFSVFGFSTPGPGRWFQFDSGSTLPWTDRPGGQASGGNSAQQLQQALAAWTNDPGSRIFLSYAGTQASSPVCSSSSDPGCFTGHVLWNDPNNEIEGSFSCSIGGVLGIGGSLAFSNGQSFNGQTWYPRARARVVIQDGAGCFMAEAGGANGAELLAHEIGHTLAFGHSCGDSASPTCGSSSVLNQAIMRAFAHGGGRGATLGADDLAGAAEAYPPLGDATPPTVPTSLTASAAGQTSISLGWAASTDTGGSGLAGYRVERCQGPSCSNFQQVATPTTNSALDSGLTAGATYRYRVRAVDGAGNFSAYSNIAQLLLPPLPCATPCLFRNSFE